MQWKSARVVSGRFRVIHTRFGGQLMQKRLLGILASMAVIMAACGGATTSSAPPAASGEPPASGEASAPPEGGLAAEQILRYAIVQDPATLDPNAAQDSESISILGNLHRGLVYYDENMQVVPALAESWEISEDSQTLTFHLRDAQYSNGDPIVAGDFVYSWRRLADPRTAAPYSYVMGEVEGAPELLAMAGADPAPSDADIDAALDGLGVEATDDSTLVVQLNTPATYFLTALALWVFVPIQESWITSENATEAANYVSSGPFMLGTWDHNSQIILTPNPNWYGTAPTLTEVQLSIVADLAAIQAGYEAGELDAVNPVDTPDIQRVKDDPLLSPEYSEVPTLAITYYNYNNGTDPSGEGTLARCQDPKACPTTNKNFRIALTQAIDKDAFIAATFAGLGQVANSIVMPGIPGYDETIDPYPFDLDAANASMDTALQELGFASAAEIPPLKFGFNTGGGHEPRVAFLAEAWRQAFGLETEQIGSDFAVFLTQRTAGEYDIARNGWGADYPHANNQLNGLFNCGGGNNDNQYCNPAFDELLAQAAVEPDQDAQAEIYKEAQRILMDDAATLPLRFGLSPQLLKPWVSGALVTPNDATNPGDRFFETISILEH
jgi:oligopeptide transport system substrate-binding protein